MTTSSSALGFEAVQTSPSLKLEDAIPAEADNYTDSVKSCGPSWVDQDRCSNRISALNFAFMRSQDSESLVKESEFKKIAKSYLAFIETGAFE